MQEDIIKELQKKLDKIKEDSEIEDIEDENEELNELLQYFEKFDELDKEISDMFRSQTIDIELVHPDAILPSFAYPTDSGFDLHSVEEVTIEPFGRALVNTGLKVSFPIGYELQVRPKSGLALKQGLTVLNTPGTVDAGYTGEVKVIIFNTNNLYMTIEKGMKIAQAVLCPVMNGKYVILNKVDKIGEKDRGDNGFGSTGIK